MMPLTTRELQTDAAELLHQGLRIIRDEQLRNGEIPNYQCMADQSWQYCFSPLISTYIYDALSCFDPQSARFEPQAAERCDQARRLPFLRSVALIRQRIRRFLAWQESSTGGWRFFGQGSGLPPDLDLTACAATVFIDPNTSPLSTATDQRVRDLERFRAVDGTLQSPQSRGEGPADWVLFWMANCNGLRYLALTGSETSDLEAIILEGLQSVEIAQPNALPLQYAAARAWLHGKFDSFPTVRSILLPAAGAGEYGAQGPLSAALSVLVLLELGAPDEDLDPAVVSLLNWWTSPLNRKFERFCGPYCGSPALTAAMMMAAVARAGTARVFVQ